MNHLRTYKSTRPRADVIFIPLPRELWTECPCKCQCTFCQNGLAYWDTLAVPTNGKPTWTIHFPELQQGPSHPDTLKRLQVMTT